MLQKHTLYRKGKVMAIESSENGGFSVTGEADTRLFQVIALTSMLRTEIRTGTKFSHRGSPFQMLKRLGIIPENTKTKKKGLEIAEKYLDEEKKRRKAPLN